MGWPRGEATDCKSVYRGSNPLPTSFSGSRESTCALICARCGSLQLMDRGSMAGLIVGGAIVFITMVLAGVLVARG